MIVGYHASHEQFRPDDLLRWTVSAEEAGFGAAMCSDHAAPWSETQGESGFAWSWLGAALQATSISLGSVTTPGYRYHPLIVAQAAATLAAMYEGRSWLALGSGEAMNERMVGSGWPVKSEREARLGECIEIIRALLRGETVTHHGRVTLDEARVWSLPRQSPMLVGAALSEKTAKWCGTWADALITVNSPAEKLRRIIDAFREEAGGKPVYLQVHLSWAESDAVAQELALRHWSTAVLPANVGQELAQPAAFDALARFIDLEAVQDAVRISSDVSRHLDWLEQDSELGVDRIYLHNVGPNQDAFIERFGQSVLPQLKK